VAEGASVDKAVNERAAPGIDAAPRSLRLAWPLLAVLAAAALLLALMAVPAGTEGSVPAAAWLVLLAPGVLLVLLVQNLARRAAQAEALARRVADLEQQLSRATRQRAEMLEKISHDLRTPLASMQGYLELLLLRGPQLDPVEADNYLQTAARHSQRLAQRVADLFELVRLESDTVVVQREPFALAELAHDVVQRFAAAAARAEVALRVEGLEAAQSGALFVHAEVRLVERLLANLVDNALRHTPGGGQVCVRIDPGNAAADAAPVSVSVVDSGTGIAGAELAGLFERHENAARVGDTGSSRPGLGLAIARRIAALHGSTLDVRSQPGAGTCVSFTLPRAPRALRPAAPSETRRNAS
jgi:hypothetical protein